MFSQHRSPLFRSNSRVSKIPAACNRAAAACASFARFHSLETFHLERTPPEMHNFVSQPLFPAQWFALSPLCSNSDRNVTRVAIGKKKKKIENLISRSIVSGFFLVSLEPWAPRSESRFTERKVRVVRAGSRGARRRRFVRMPMKGKSCSRTDFSLSSGLYPVSRRRIRASTFSSI